MTILIANVYSYKNKGDAAIVLSLINEINRAFPGAVVVAQTADTENDTEKYGVSVTSSLLWILLSSVRRSNPFVRVLKLTAGLLTALTYALLYKALKIKASFILSTELREYFAQLHNATFVIGCGGGYLRTGRNNVYDSLLLYVTCLNLRLPTLLNKKLYLYSQSIGPVHGWLQHKMLHKVLNAATIVEPREKVSVEYLKSLGFSSPKHIIETADPVLLLGSKKDAMEANIEITEGRLPVGMTVRKWFKDADKFENYLDSIAKNLDYLIEQKNAEIFYLPQVIATGFGDDDRIVAEQVHKRVRNKQFFKLINQDMHPYEMINFCSKMHIFIGTRMHSNIFSLITHVPVVAIEYEFKTRGIMRGLGIEELTQDINTVNPASLRGLIDKLLADRQYYSRLIATNLESEKKKSSKAINVIQKDYARSN